MTVPVVPAPADPEPDLAIAAQPLTYDHLITALRDGVCLPCPACHGSGDAGDCRGCLGSGFIRPCHACGAGGLHVGSGRACLVCGGRAFTAGDPPSLEDGEPAGFGRRSVSERRMDMPRGDR